jgi:tetratricopeptide (TPR) repeat protein
MQLQGAGKYQEAVAAYREALNRTSDSGRIHQQIAICQQRSGQKDQAVQSYKSAIRSYRDQLAAGRDASEVQRNIRSCEAGIEVLTNQN